MKKVLILLILFLTACNVNNKNPLNSVISLLTGAREKKDNRIILLALFLLNRSSATSKPNYKPSIPNNLVAVSDFGITLSWNASTDRGGNIIDYEVSKDNVHWVSNGVNLTHTFTDLIIGKTYNLQVRAKDNQHAYSDTVSIIWKKIPVSLSQKIASKTKSDIHFYWDKFPKNTEISEYQVKMKDDKWEKSSSNLTHTFKAAIINDSTSTYRLQVRAKYKDDTYSHIEVLNTKSIFASFDSNWSNLSVAWKKAIAGSVSGISESDITLSSNQKYELFKLNSFNYSGGKEGNGIRNLEFIKYMTNLTSLSLDNNLLTTIPTGAFSHLSSLTSLDLGNNQLSHISSNAFKGLNHLTKLRLNDNQLRSIDRDAFKGLNRLNQLVLGSNQLSSIESGTFRDLGNLQSLDLNSNQIVNVSDAFKDLNRLSKLELNNNRLNIDSKTFKGLNRLNQLWLNDNRLTNILDNVFTSMDYLKTLYLEQASHTWDSNTKNLIRSQVRARPEGSGGSGSEIFFSSSSVSGTRL